MSVPPAPSPETSRPRHIRRPVRLCGSSPGFSLIEVCLAIGILAFAILPIVALLPTGLNTFRGSIDTSIGSQIAQHVINDLQQTDYQSITSGTRYFDTSGGELSAANGSIYTVLISATTAMQNTALNVSSNNLATISIQIANNPNGAKANPFGVGNTPNITSYCAYVARSK